MQASRLKLNMLLDVGLTQIIEYFLKAKIIGNANQVIVALIKSHMHV